MRLRVSVRLEYAAKHKYLRVELEHRPGAAAEALVERLKEREQPLAGVVLGPVRVAPASVYVKKNRSILLS